MSDKDMLPEDSEMGIFDLWRIVRSGWRFIALGTTLGLIGGMLAIWTSPSMFQATAIIQPGLVGGREIEPTNTAREQLKAPAFVMEAGRRAGETQLVEFLVGGDGDLPARVKALNVKGTNMIELKTWAENPDSAKRLNEVLLAYLVVRHEEKSVLMKDKIKLDIEAAKARLLGEEQELAALPKVPSGILLIDSQFAPFGQLPFERSQKQAEVFLLKQHLMALEQMLLPPATFTTHAIESIYVPSRPVSPNAALLLFIGLIGGLGMGWIGAFFVDSWRKGRAKHAREASS
jgi:hypothetical protein